MKEDNYIHVDSVGFVDKRIWYARSIGIETMRILNGLAITHFSKKKAEPLSLELIARLFNSEEIEIDIGENKAKVIKEIIHLEWHKPTDEIIEQPAAVQTPSLEWRAQKVKSEQRSQIIFFYKENRPGYIAVYLVRHSKQDSDNLYNQDTPLTPYKTLDLILRRCAKENYHLHTVSMHYNQDKYKDWIIGIISFCREKELIRNIKELGGLAEVNKVSKNNQKMRKILEDASSYNQTNPYLPLGEQFREEPEGWKKMLLDLYARKSRK